MKTKIIISGITMAFILSGCAATYSLDGVKYDNKESFHAAVENQKTSAVAKIQPLQKPLTDRNLIFAIPKAEVLVAASKQNFAKIEGRQPLGIAAEILENIPLANHKLSVVYGDAIEKRGIYQSVRQVPLESMDSTLQPTAKDDVLYYTEPTIGSGQWFYASSKHGRQVFAFDRSKPGVDGKISAFLDAVQAQAIRE